MNNRNNYDLKKMDAEQFLREISLLRLSKLARGNLYIQRGLVTDRAHQEKKDAHDLALEAINAAAAAL